MPTKNPARVSRSSAGVVGVSRDSKVEQLHSTRHRIVHDVVRLQVAVHDVLAMRGFDGCGDLNDDCGRFGRIEVALALGVLLEEFARRPFDGEKGNPAFCFAGLDGTHDILMFHTRAELGLTNESGDCGGILAESLRAGP